MATDIRLKEGLPEITEALVATYTECRYINHLGHKPLPSREAIVGILELPWVTGQIVHADGGLALHSPIDAYGQLQRVMARKK